MEKCISFVRSFLTGGARCAMQHNDILAAMVSPLCSWYEQNKRVLPWRENRDPYRIWVSEIMLQQTRVEAALPYYQRFLKALPTVCDLAEAPMEQLLKLWEGLGYYSRVRNMQKAAQTVVEIYGGVFPADRALLEKLSGIGDYTAGAIASIAFNLPEPAVDGNVLRVVARLLNDETDIMLPKVKRDVKEKLKEVYPKAKDCGDLTQALMELGALICIPGGAPKCEACPLSRLCLAKQNGREKELPVRNTKKEKKLVKRTVFVLESDGFFALVKRPEKGVLAGMWEFPTVEGVEETPPTGCALEISPLIHSRHVFTHLIWEMDGFYVKMADRAPEFHWVTARELMGEIALPSAMKPFKDAVLEKLGISRM